MERHERQANGRARDLLPAGFVIIREGDIRPDDLVFSWSSNEWIRADDGAWLQPTSSLAIADCVAVARSARFAEPQFENADRRTYKLTPSADPPANNAGPGVTIADLVRPAVEDPSQLSLF